MDDEEQLLINHQWHNFNADRGGEYLESLEERNVFVFLLLLLLLHVVAIVGHLYGVVGWLVVLLVTRTETL